jgi:anti-sigma regulatory factor (Ser/Thr protein kinase)
MTDTRTHRSEHVVAFYDDDREVIEQIVRFYREGLAADEATILIATAEHRIAIETAMAANVDLDRIKAAGRFVALDAAETLATFMVDGAPDAERFRETIGGVIREAARVSSGIRAFGEMVALLWGRGNVTAAIDLEGLWNDLADELDFALLCAYPLDSVVDRDDLESLTRVCGSHSDLFAPGSYMNHATAVAPAATANENSMVFVPVLAAITAARAFAEQTLRAWGADDLVADVTVVVSELATNAVMHADSAFRVTLGRSADVITIAVEDIDPTTPVHPVRAINTIGGLGLVLVDRLTTRWGTDLLPSGKRVWCEIARD